MDSEITFSKRRWRFFVFILIFLGTILGFTIDFVIQEYGIFREAQLLAQDNVRYKGFITYAQNKASALDYAYGKESSGDWVCVNIKGMNYKDAVQTCQHEAAHELFAQACEQDTELCHKTQSLLEEYTNER